MYCLFLTIKSGDKFDMSENLHVEKNYKTIYSNREEIYNSFSHVLGIIFSVIAIFLLIFQSLKGDSLVNLISCVIYGFALIMMYSASSMYHYCKVGTLKAKLRIIDHLNIYILIAGTYTPIALIALNGAVGWVIFSLMWTLAILGIIYKLTAFGSSWVSSLLYILMGWVAIFFIVQIIDAIPTISFMLLLLGGMFYTCGVVFYMLDEIYEFMHFIWHIFVLLGSVFHFFAIFLYIAPMNIY